MHRSSLPRANGGRGLKLLYHGSIVPERVPYALIEALARLPEEVTLDLTGYETVGSSGYLKKLRDLANTRNVTSRLAINGAVSRRALMGECTRFDVGIALIPRKTSDANFLSMTGASNKPFDYLACGLPVLVSDLPDWREMFVQPGYGLACDPSDPSSIAAAVLTLYEDPVQMRAMGELGRQRILSEWNYESQFQGVMNAWTTPSRP